MADYIDREKLIAELEEEIEYESGMLTREQNYFLEHGLRIALKDIKHMPTEDVVPVVRCKDCKSYNGHRYCNYHADPVDDNDYCSYGERKCDSDV